MNDIDKEKYKKKRKKRKMIVLSIVTVVVVIIMIHFFTVLNLNPRYEIADAINETIPHLTSAPFEIEIEPIQIGGMCLALFIVWLLSMIKQTEKELKKHDNSDTVNGDAHLMNAKELDEYQRKFCAPLGKPGINGFNNMILSKDIRLAIDNRGTRRNCNVLCIGGSGAGKSRFFASPNILQYNANFVITDPSGELLNDYGKALENAGYEVLVFNLTDVYRSNRYNPFHYIREEKDVFLLINTLIKNTTPPEAHQGDPIWENGEKLVMEALILYLWHTAPKEKQNFSTVVKMLQFAEIDENDATVESPLDVMFKKLEQEDPENLAVEQYRLFKIAAGKTAKSFLISVGSRLEKFKLSDIKYLTEDDDFHFESFADSKKALFIVIPTADTTFNFLASLLYSQMFMSLYNYCETRAAYGWQAQLGRFNILKVEQAENKDDSKNAKKRLEAFVKEIKSGCEIIENEDKQYFEIRTKKGTLVAWRGTKEAAEKLVSKLPKLKVVPCKRACPYHVRLILDEFANIGQIPDFNEKLSTIRKYEISCNIILQALSQLKTLYKDQWNTIVANCDTKLFLGCDDTETIKWMLEVFGKKTTTVENTSYQANGNGSTSYNKSSIEVMTIDKMTMMQDDECVVRIRGNRPYYGKKFDLEKHPNYKAAKELADCFEVKITDEAKEFRDKHKGPLQERKSKAVKEEKATTETPKAEGTESAADSPKETGTTSSGKKPQRNKTDKERNEENDRRKAEAEKKGEEAKKGIEEVEKDETPPDMTAEQEEKIATACGIDKDSSIDQIKEALESCLSLNAPSKDIIKYVFSK